MIQLQKPVKYIEKLLGTPSKKENTNYRFLNFCLIHKMDSDVLIFNNMTKALALIEESEYTKLIESNFTKPESLVLDLIKDWFLVPTDTDDIALSDQLINLAKLFDTDTKLKNFTILPTTGCNARCFYCFEAGAKITTMDEQTAKDVACYIIEQYAGEKIRLNWFGGEPLCNIRAINTICKILTENNIPYYSTMTSNAYAFNENMISIAKDVWKLQWIQITLDGLAESYNKIKNYKNNDNNAFDRVLNNIETLCKNEITVQLRMNLGTHNAEEIFSLTDFLHQRFGKYSNFSLYAQPIYENVGFEKLERNDEDRKEIFEIYKKLCEHFIKLGIKKRRADIKEIQFYSCQADRKSWVMILPDGHLGCCEHNIDNDFFGSIYDKIPKPNNWSEYKSLEEKCKNCVAYPTCITLKKCPSGNRKCYDYEQFIRIDTIINAIEAIYKDYVDNKSR